MPTSVRSITERAAVLTFGLATLLLVAQAAGCFAPVNARLFALLVLVTIALVVSAGARIPASGWLAFGAGLVLSLGDDSAVLWCGAAAVAFGGLALAPGTARRDLTALATAAAFLALTTALVAGVPAAWIVLRQASLAVSGALGAWRGHPLRLGPSASGMWPVLVALVLVSAQLGGRLVSSARGLAAVALLGTALVAYLGIADGLPTGTRESAFVIVNHQWLAAVLALPAVWVAAGASLSAADPTPRRRVMAALAAGTVAFALIAVTPPSPRSGVRVLLLDEGFLDWKVPVYGQYGPYATGLFGLLPDYLRLVDAAPLTRPGPVTDALLAGADVLVVINPQKRWPPEEMQAIWRFVEGGGGLLVLGDHTDLVGTRDSLNQLLHPAGISFRFDSGFPCREQWWHSLAVLRHPVALGIRSWEDVVVSIGASLDVEPPGYPVLTGRYGFSDLGNVLNEQGAYLGDYSYERGELLGDVVLVAAAHVGQGRVVVLGDTSPLQNGALSFSLERFVTPLVRWLSDREGSHPWGGPAGVLLFGIGVLGVWAVAGDAPAAILVGLAVVGGASAGVRYSLPSPVSPHGPIAWVDASHAERTSIAGLEDDGLGAICVTLARSGYRPLLMRRFDEGALRGGRLFVTLAPMRPFTGGELDAVERFVRGGGLLIATSGWPERHGSEALLARFGVQVMPQPLGPAPVVRDDQQALTRTPTFVSAWALTARPGPVGRAHEIVYVPAPGVENPDTVADVPDDPSAGGFTRVLYETAGSTVVGFRAVGAGGVVAIGDPRFLGDGNLENLRSYHEGNILFVRGVLADVTADAAVDGEAEGRPR